MESAIVNKVIGWNLYLGAPLVSLFLLVSNVTDPVNVTKQFVAVGIGISLALVLLVFKRKALWNENRILTIAIILFVLAAVIATILSRSPFNQNFYGTYGRNTGFLAYFALCVFLLGSTTVRDTKVFTRVIYGFMFAGSINLIYCTWVLLFGDFVGWSNPYGTILGTFGNPDFISAFFGMFFSVLISFSAKQDLKWYFRSGFLSLAILTLFEIKKSHAIQGLVVSAGGIAIVGFYLIKCKYQSRAFTWLYSLTVTALGFVSILGTLQKGPLDFVYKRSVSFRGTYWRTGINMGMENPFSGVGMDSYGDWYRRFRPLVALQDTPGPKTVSNVAHNVYVDMFAFGGFPLLLTHLTIVFLTARAIFNVTKRMKRFDWVFVATTAGWVTFQVQSFISINQIGLAIWGWVFAGILIAMSKVNYESEGHSKRDQKLATMKAPIFTPGLVAGVGMVVGLMISAPPLNADMKWRAAIQSRSVAVAESLSPSYMNPRDSYRLADAINTMMASNLNELALKYSRIAVRYNPNFFPTWRMLYLLPNSSQSEKETALQNMHRLDPLNKDVVND